MCAPAGQAGRKGVCVHETRKTWCACFPIIHGGACSVEVRCMLEKALVPTSRICRRPLHAMRSSPSCARRADQGRTPRVARLRRARATAQVAGLVINGRSCSARRTRLRMNSRESRERMGVAGNMSRTGYVVNVKAKKKLGWRLWGPKAWKVKLRTWAD